MANCPLISLTNLIGLCVWWGMHWLWTLRCQKAVRRMEVPALNVVMAMEVTYTEATAWFQNTEQQEVARTAEMLAVWFWLQRQSMLGEDPDVYSARRQAIKKRV